MLQHSGIAFAWGGGGCEKAKIINIVNSIIPALLYVFTENHTVHI
jgi:hypothetical protein